MGRGMGGGLEGFVLLDGVRLLPQAAPQLQVLRARHVGEGLATPAAEGRAREGYGGMGYGRRTSR